MNNKSIPKDFITQLIASSDIVEIISKSVKLKKHGNEYIGCCPFHNEKTPSFYVNQEKQIYNCFGCNASGNIITFLKEHDHLDFLDAIEELALIQGLEIPYENSSSFNKNLINNLYSTLATATKYYRWQLKFNPNSQNIIEYIKSRNISSKTAKVFQIGYAPNNWDSLINTLQSHHSTKEIIDAGLAVQKTDKLFDRFRDRIIFPIKNKQGQVIGFGGRRTSKNKKQPKYLNSPETQTFHKSSELYGLYELKQKVKNPKEILVVEGYMDVISLYEYEYFTSVATLGTSITINHITSIFRHTNNIILCFDGDQAGQKAALKAAKISLTCISGAKQVKFIKLPDGEDPDSYIQKKGLKCFQNLITNASPLIDFIFNYIPNRNDNIAKLIDFITDLINGITETSYIIQIKHKLSQITGASIKQIDNIMHKSVKHNSTIEKHSASKLKIPKTLKDKNYTERTLSYLLIKPQLLEKICLESKVEIHSPSDITQLIINQILKLDNKSNLKSHNTSTIIQSIIDIYPEYEAYILHLISNPLKLTDSEMSKEIDVTLKKLQSLGNTQHLNQLLEKSKSYPLSEVEKQRLWELLQKKLS